MAKYWYNCQDCNKKIKKQLGFSGIPLCLDCSKNRRKRNCIVCGKEFNPHCTNGHRGNRAKFCSKSCSSKYTLKGRNLSKEHKERLSISAFNNKGGYSNVKYYKIFCPFLNKEINVQGTWELKYAQMLNENKILWNRGKGIFLKYILNKNDIKRTYFPDFYLIEKDIYIEIKGFFTEKDKIKMRCVKTQNKTKKILILRKNDLKKLNILS